MVAVARLPLGALGCALALAVCPAGAAGQTGVAPPLEPPAWGVDAVASRPRAFLPLLPEPPAVPAWALDSLPGLPRSARFQRSLAGDCAWWAEGLLGLLTPYPVVGGGLRRRFVPWAGDNHCVSISPGLDIYALVDPFADEDRFLGPGPLRGGGLTADVDVVWKHSFGNFGQTELGVRLGTGVGYGSGPARLPILNALLGCRF
ncbi:MAG: hypothetical protein NZ700_11110 [Gemmataceae bacterium]|nr:hypothetical protein [Gemmataceae bacterium]MDW8265515.1 hypothetical protein [Gemmataceae bacterium]